eukprot:3546204-Alexandrium_andersonii.AAC.1
MCIRDRRTRARAIAQLRVQVRVCFSRWGLLALPCGECCRGTMRMTPKRCARTGHNHCAEALRRAKLQCQAGRSEAIGFA